MSKRELAYVVFDRETVRFWYFSPSGNHWGAEDYDLDSLRVKYFCIDRTGKPNQIVYSPDGRMYVYPLPDNCTGYICFADKNGAVVPLVPGNAPVEIPVRDRE